MDYLELHNKAESLIKNKSFNEGLIIYEKIKNEFPEKISKWDEANYATCLRKCKRTKEALEICREIYKNTKDFRKIRNLYAWCIYDLEIKKDIERIKFDEKIFYKAAKGIIELTESKNDDLSYIITIFKVIEYIESTGNQYPAEEISKWINALSPEFLDQETYVYTNKDGKTFEAVSKLEKWYKIKIKVAYYLEQYSECIDLTEKAISVIKEFHSDNDIWISRYKALSKSKIGKRKEAIKELIGILNKKKEWYIQGEIANLYIEKEDYESANKYLFAAVLNSGEMEKKINIYTNIANNLIILKNIEMAKKHFLLVYKIRKEANWVIKQNLQNAIDNYNINISETITTNELYNKLKKYWQEEYNNDKIFINGKIKNLINEYSGFIIDMDNNRYFFNISDFKSNKKDITLGVNVRFLSEKRINKKKNCESNCAIEIYIKE